MSIQRRNLLLSALPFGAGLLLESHIKTLAADVGVQNTEFDQDTYHFWTSEVAKPSEDFAEHGRIVSQRGLSLGNEAAFLFYSKETGFVRAASTETDTPLTRSMLEKGDASLLLALDTIRPSGEHLRKIYERKNGSLRIDLKQAVPLQQLSETLNWSAIASLVPGERPLAGYHEILFDPKSTWGQAKKVPLTGGIGFWSWNFSSQPKPSIWTQVMGILGGLSAPSSDASGGEGDPQPQGKKKPGKPTKSAGKKVLGLGLPAIAQTALAAFNQLFGSMFSSGSAGNEWIIHSADKFLLATQEARQHHPGQAIALRSGAYLVFDGQHTQELLSGKYELREGMVVPKDSQDGELEQAAKDTLPELSYIALSALVEPIV